MLVHCCLLHTRLLLITQQLSRNTVWPYFTGNYSKRGVWERHLSGMRTNIPLAGHQQTVCVV
jgi:hypothetical protein